jgi:hypothetical protein
VLILTFGLAACGGSGPSGSAGGSGPGDGAGGGPVEGGDSAAGGSAPEPGSTAVPADAPIARRIANLDLDVVAYRVPDVLAEPDDRQLAAMLRALDLTPAEVSLVIGVDRAGRLAIGRWGLPGRNADAILAAWSEAAGTAWQTLTLGEERALSGRGPDGSRAWAVARDGVFVYVVTDDPALATQAVAGTR